MMNFVLKMMNCCIKNEDFNTTAQENGRQIAESAKRALKSMIFH